MRIYQGMLKRGQFIVNARTGKRIKVPRVIQMHADQMQVSHYHLNYAQLLHKFENENFIPT